MVWDPDGGVVDVNPAIERMLGAPRELMIGQPRRRRCCSRPAAARCRPSSFRPRASSAPAAASTRSTACRRRRRRRLGLRPLARRAGDGTIASPSPDHRGRGEGALGRAHHDPRRRVARPRVDVRRRRDDRVRQPVGRGALGLRQDEVIGRLWRAITHPEDVPLLRAALADAGPDEPRTPMLEVRLRAREALALGRGPGHAALPQRPRGRRRDHRPRRHPHARRRGHGPPAVVAAGGAGRRCAGRDHHGRRAGPDRRHQRAGVLAAGARDEPRRAASARTPAHLRRACAACSPSPRPRSRGCTRSPRAASRCASSPSSARTAGASASTTCRSRRGGRLWTFRDITQFKLMEEEQRGFLATMSHEIKTPLSGIAGAAELLRGARLHERERELAEVISDAAQSLTGLLRDVLDVSRAEAGREETEAADYDPRRLLTSVAGVLRPSLRGRAARAARDVDPTVPGRAARRRRPRAPDRAQPGVQRGQVHRGGRRARSTPTSTATRCRSPSATPAAGSPRTDLQRLFEPWTRNHGRAWAGTGLGLVIARRLARAMGGDVTVVSTLGEGSAFTLELPLRPARRRRRWASRPRPR